MRNRKKERKTTNNKKLKPHLWFTLYGRERERICQRMNISTQILHSFTSRIVCDERYREYLLHDAIHIDKFSCRSCKYLLPK